MKAKTIAYIYQSLKLEKEYREKKYKKAEEKARELRRTYICCHRFYEKKSRRTGGGKGRTG